MRGRVPRLRASSFVPVVCEVTAEEVPEVPGFAEAVGHWTGGEESACEWVRETRREWGNCGFYLCRGEECLGFVLYGPPERLPRAYAYSPEPTLAPLSGEGAILGCLTGDHRSAKRLLVRMLKDLRERRLRRVEAVASDAARRNHAATETLVRAGWRPVERALCGGRFYTLVELDLAGTVEAPELARSFMDQVGQVRLPRLGRKASGSPSGALAAESLDESSGVSR